MIYTLFNYSQWGLFALHVVVGAIFIVHGHQKWAMWKMAPSEQMPAGMINLMRFLSIAETLGGIAMFFGFLTQLAAIGLSLIMLGALYFKIFVWKTGFAPQGKSGWELDLLILAACIALMTNGAGTMSLDWLM